MVVVLKELEIFMGNVVRRKRMSRAIHYYGGLCRDVRELSLFPSVTCCKLRGQ